MYKYEEHRAALFTDQGQRMLLAVRDRVGELLRQAGAFQMHHAFKGVGGDSWEQLACIDRLVELGEIRAVDPNEPVMTQDRVYVKA